MARKAVKQDITDVTLNGEALADASTALTTLGEIQRQANENAQALAVDFNYSGELSVPALEDEIRFFQRRTAEACLELGKRLLFLKELTPPGDFMSRVESLGIHRRMGQRFMSAALKFSKSDKKSLLNAAGTQTKLLELVTLEDEELEILNEGGSVRGITLDTVAQMGMSELRTKLREADAVKAAKEKLLIDKNALIDDLTATVEKKYKPSEGELSKNLAEATALKGLNDALDAAEVHFVKLANVVAELQGTGREPLQKRGEQGIEYLASRIREIVILHNLQINLSEDALGGKPEWMND